MVKCSAFVFIKPHACTEAVKACAKETLAAKGFKILTEGSLTGPEIDAKQLIDNHYYSIAMKATLLPPAELNVPEDKFEAKFGLGWKEALEKGVVFNAKQACEKLGLDAAGLDALWGASKKAGNLVKFGGGFYCGLVEGLYVFNGFFMEMRSAFVAADAAIYYFVVEWDSLLCSWGDFRAKVLGPTDPADAPLDSLRGVIAANWEALGLKGACSIGENGVHASASPFEALAERMNWLGVALEEDAYGQALLAAGLPKETILAWSKDPQVPYEGGKTSLFDSVEDTDSDGCAAKLLHVAAEGKGEVPAVPEAALTVMATDYKLWYFAFTGAAEVARTLFALGGLYPGAGYEDFRFAERADFTAASADGTLGAANFDRVPMLTAGGVKIGQSGAINRFLAGQFGLLGASPIEQALVDAIVEHCAEWGAGFKGVCPPPYLAPMSDAEKAAAQDVWFNTPAEPKQDFRKERMMAWFVQKLEATVGGDGFAVGTAPSLADACLYNKLVEGGFGNKERSMAALAAAPKLAKIVARFGSLPAIVKWLEVRP